MAARILTGDCRDVLRTLGDESVHCIVTSPPYFGLRDYGTANWDGGDPVCDHLESKPSRTAASAASSGLEGGKGNIHRSHAYGQECGRCGARRIDRQIGLETTPDAYVAELVSVFRECRRVLRKDGTLWLNLGDSYAGSGKSGSQRLDELGQRLGTGGGHKHSGSLCGRAPTPSGLKTKDLIGIPWSVAFALRADGWYLRQEIIWQKMNPMPESVQDRCTKAHEQIFLLSKSPRYFYDADAIMEGIGEPGIIHTADFNYDRLIFGQHRGVERSNSRTADVCVRLATTILDLSQSQNESGLSTLDPKVGHQSASNGAGSGAIGNPIMRRAAAEASRFADGDISAKEFLRQVHGLCVALPDGDNLKELWISAGLAASPTVPLIDANSDRAVAVNDAGEVGEIERVHKQKYTTQDTRSSHMKNTPRNDGARWREADGGVAPRGTRNKRSVWTIATQPFSEAHFATFPPDLIEPCIKAGTSEKGCCAKCGAPWKRITEYGRVLSTGGSDTGARAQNLNTVSPRGETNPSSSYVTGNMVQREKITTGWSPSCSCNAAVVPCTVLDCFGGAGTTALVADRLQRNSIIIELNESYANMARRRIEQDAGMFAVTEAA